MVLGFGHPMQHWVMGTIGRIEIWLHPSLVEMEFLYPTMGCREHSCNCNFESFTRDKLLQTTTSQGDMPV